MREKTKDVPTSMLTRHPSRLAWAVVAVNAHLLACSACEKGDERFVCTISGIMLMPADIVVHLTDVSRVL